MAKWLLIRLFPSVYGGFRRRFNACRKIMAINSFVDNWLRRNKGFELAGVNVGSDSHDPHSTIIGLCVRMFIFAGHYRTETPGGNSVRGSLIAAPGCWRRRRVHGSRIAAATTPGFCIACGDLI